MNEIFPGTTLHSDAVEVTRYGKYFPENSKILQARAQGGKIYLENVEMWIDNTKLLSQDRKLHLMVHEAAISSQTELVLANNYAYVNVSRDGALLGRFNYPSCIVLC